MRVCFLSILVRLCSCIKATSFGASWKRSALRISRNQKWCLVDFSVYRFKILSNMVVSRIVELVQSKTWDFRHPVTSDKNSWSQRISRFFKIWLYLVRYASLFSFYPGTPLFLYQSDKLWCIMEALGVKNIKKSKVMFTLFIHVLDTTIF
jgi:hypothetical protein